MSKAGAVGLREKSGVIKREWRDLLDRTQAAPTERVDGEVNGRSMSLVRGGGLTGRGV